MSCFRFVRASVTYRVMESVVSFGGRGICHKCLMLESVSSFERGEFILQVQCWKVSGRSSGVGDGGWDSVLGSVIEPVSSVVVWGDCLSSHILESISFVGGWIVSVKCPVLNCVLSFVRSAVSLTRPVLQSISSFGGWGVSLTRPVLASGWSCVRWGVYLTRTVLASVSSFGEWGISGTCPVLEICLGWGDCLKRPVL